MTEHGKALQGRRPPARGPASTWRLLAKYGVPGAGVLVAECAGTQALPVFSGEGEAEMFFWLGGAFEDGWQIRETTDGELVSILYGPCAGVGWVMLDPSPQMTPEMTRSESVSRERFVSWILNRPCSFSAPAVARRHARSLVGPA
jgi:hypothetical protein